MSTGPQNSARRGVALIIVLGVLAVLSVLIVGLSRSMRNERLAARKYADMVRAKLLVHAGLVRAMENVGASMAGMCYPYWDNQAFTDSTDAMASGGECPQTNDFPLCPDILRGTVTNLIPAALWPDALAAATNCHWTNIVSGDVTNGRVAYLVVNCSGLLDAHVVGGTTTRLCRAGVDELDLSALPEMADLDDFFADRKLDRRYETVAELGRVNVGVNPPISNFFVYSYDPGRDAYYTNRGELGQRAIELREKAPVNALTNYAGYYAPGFVSGYWQPLTNQLIEAGLSNGAAEIAWNIVNYIDADRVPQNGYVYPWQYPIGIEAVPLINEIVLREASGFPSNHYQFVVELWYPFAPVSVGPWDDFSLRMGVFSNLVSDVLPTGIMDRANAEWSTNCLITNMTFGTPTEFVCVTSPPVFFPVVSTNVPPTTNYLPITATSVWFLARVCQGTNEDAIVDEAMGYLPGDLEPVEGRRLKQFTDTVGYSVDDPRVNGEVRFWMGPYHATNATLGTTNYWCMAWAGQGVPIYHADAPMRSIGEVGHIYRSDLAATGQYWQTISITNADQGAALLDRLTVRDANRPSHGLVCISSAQSNALSTLFQGMEIGWSNALVTTRYPLTDAEVESLAEAVVGGGPYWDFRHLCSIPDVQDALTNAARDAVHRIDPNVQLNDILLEEPLRNIVEMVTFRQNLFMIVIAAQALAPDGLAVLGEKRAVAVVCRDSYTGRWLTRSLTWLSE